MDEDKLPEKYRYKPVRRIVYHIDQQTLLKCLKGYIYAQNLPDDVEFVSAHYSPKDQAFQLVLESMEFTAIDHYRMLETRCFLFEHAIP